MEQKEAMEAMNQAKMLSFEEKVDQVLAEVRTVLIMKNQAYGNSALEPCRVFSKASNIEQLLVRIDDKISRIKTRGLNASAEDTVMDLIGYLILLIIAQGSRVTREEMECNTGITTSWESDYHIVPDRA